MQCDTTLIIQRMTQGQWRFLEIINGEEGAEAGGLGEGSLQAGFRGGAPVRV